MAIFKFEDLAFSILAILSSHSNILTGIILLLLHINYIIAITKLTDRNFGKFAANFAKIKLCFKCSA